MPFVGAAVRRFEDPRLLRGRASFIEDLDLPRQLQVAFVRSEYPHARLVSVDLEPAYRVAGVVGAFGGLELGPRRIHATVTHAALRQCGQPILADGRVRYVGEPIAVVVDRLAQELGLDPAEARHKNLIRPDEFPWDVGTPTRLAALLQR